MWYYVIPFVLAFGYKMFQRDVAALPVPQPRHDSFNNVAFMSSFCFFLGLLLCQKNMPAYIFDSARLPVAIVAFTVACIQRLDSNDIAYLVMAATSQAIVSFYAPSPSPWTQLVVFTGTIGTMERGRAAALMGTVAVVGYTTLMTMPVHYEFTWINCLALTTWCVWNTIAVVFTGLASRRIKPCALIALYNVIYVFQSTTPVPKTWTATDSYHTALVSTAMFMLQYCVITWIRESGIVSYSLARFLQNLLIAIMTPVPDITYIVASITMWLGVIAYSIYPWNQTLPDREPSVPPLPPDSPKPDRKEVKPTAPLDDPEQRATVVVPNETV